MSIFDRVIDRHHTNSFKWDKYPKEVIPVWVADMDFRAAPPILEALDRVTRHGVFGYSRCPNALDEIMVERLRERHQWQVQKEWFTWIGGLVPAIGFVIRAVTQPGEAVMTATPVYHPFMIETELADRELQKVPLRLEGNRWTLDFEAIEKAITPDTKLFLLCNPHNPVGTMFRQDELWRLHQICHRHGIIVCSDEIHCDLILDASQKHISYATLSPEAAQESFTLLAPSKTFNLAGLGCSVVVTPNDALREKFVRAKAGLMPMLSAYAYEAALAAYRDGAEWHAELLEYLKGNHDYLLEELNQLKGVQMLPLEATYLAWVDMRGTGISDIAKRLEEAGVGVNDGSIFGQPGFVRINFACPRATLQEVVRRIKTIL
ncbi:MAG: MalY/PatB family protein [Runella sp.]